MWNLGSWMQQWHGSVWLQTNTDVPTNEGVRYHASKQMKQISTCSVYTGKGVVLEAGRCLLVCSSYQKEKDRLLKLSLFWPFFL